MSEDESKDTYVYQLTLSGQELSVLFGTVEIGMLHTMQTYDYRTTVLIASVKHILQNDSDVFTSLNKKIEVLMKALAAKLIADNPEMSDKVDKFLDQLKEGQT